MDPEQQSCPCGHVANLAGCCGRYLSGAELAPTPEALMRSRYTAFAIGSAQAIDYLVATQHPAHRAPDLRPALEANTAQIDGWERLEVRSATEAGDRGVVEFVATYRVGSERGELHERSDFLREDGRWYYTTGVVR